MRPVPTERMSYACDRRLLLEYLPSFIGNFRPIPTGRASQHPSLLGCQIRNEIRREAEIVGAAPSSRFRDTFGDKASLSAEMSETLEDFEAVLKATGLMDRREVLVQYATTPRKFRVQRLQGFSVAMRPPIMATLPIVHALNAHDCQNAELRFF